MLNYFYVGCRLLEEDIVYVERRQQPLRYKQVNCLCDTVIPDVLN